MQKIIFTLLTVSLVLSGCGQSDDIPSQTASKAIPITTTQPIKEEITTYIEAIGTLHPSTTVDIRPQVNGTLSAVHVAAGQTVKKGSPLFQIDPLLYDIKVQETKAQQAIDMAALDAVEKKLARFQELADKDLIAKTEWDDLLAQAAKAQAMVEIDTARLTLAHIDLDRCLIVAPIDGTLGKIAFDPGTLLSSSQTSALTTIAQLDPLIAEFSISEKDYLQLKEMPKDVEIETLCSKDFCKKATVTFLDNKFDAKTGMLVLRATVENKDFTLRPGQTLKVKVPVSTLKEALLIPYQAVRFNQNGPYVFVVLADNTAASRQLVIGEEYGNLVHVKEGLSANETVVLDGNMRVMPGAAVEIKP